jgi:CheY-like chemotaxis protein
VIQVQDTGVGIPPDQMHRLFEKFSQLESADGERTHGTGLGLAISKRLVELMGGAVEVRSRPGLGSTFTVTLPLPPAESLPHAPPAEAAFRDRRALVVARHPLSRQTLDDELRALGLRPEVAADNDAARRLLAAAVEAGDPFAVVLIDHAPVECDGIALARTVKATEALRQLPLILIAPDSLIGKTGRVETLGFAAHLSRPVRQSKLPEALRAVWSERAAPPVAPPRRPEPADEPLAPREGQTIEAHVLLVEDDKVSQIVATKMLQAIGCKVELAANGQEALEMLARTPYDLVLMDARMPVMDGYETTRELRRRAGPNQRTPVIAMTAHALQGAREKCLAAGMDDYVTKPVDPRVLRDAVRRWTKPK